MEQVRDNASFGEFMMNLPSLSRPLAVTSLVVLAAFSLGSQNADAAIATYTGEVITPTGAFAALTPPGTPVGGPIEIDDSALGGIAGVADILEINVNVGGFCFFSGAVSACPLGGAEVPITSIDAAAIDLTSPPDVAGFFSVTAFSPTFNIFIPIDFDLDAGTFFGEGAGLGTVSGVGDASLAVIPVPAAFWLFGSALLGLAGARRRGAPAS